MNIYALVEDYAVDQVHVRGRGGGKEHGVKLTRLQIIVSPMLRKTLSFHKLKATLQCNHLHSPRRCRCKVNRP